MPNQPPLNPDALANLRLLADRATKEVRHAVIEPDILHKLLDLAVAQPEVTTFEESDALPVGSVVLDVDGDTARRFPDGWRTTVVEADGRVWLSGHMEDPDLPARVLYRPEVNDA